MYAVFLTLFILVCLILVIVVLLQSSKGGGLAGAFGGGSDSSVLGGRSAATFLGKLTVWLAASFMALALLLAILSSRSRSGGEASESIISRRQQSGALDVYDVEQSAPLSSQIQTQPAPAQGGEGQPAPSPAGGSAEPAPAGN
ncbi:preprotein translocase subunit SecG [bacterium]|nr:preprotein translocase subunit SecG [bacterium]